MAAFDLILLALVSVFLIFRLYSILGQKHDKEEKFNYKNWIIDKLPEELEAPAKRLPQNKPSLTLDTQDKELAQIQTYYPEFDKAHFLQGCQIAFEQIITAFGKGDLKTLESLLAPSLYSTFAQIIQMREEQGHTQETSLIAIKSVNITSARIEGTKILIDVKIVSEQVNVTRDQNNTIIEGDDNYIDTIEDCWTFSRNINASEPHWFLYATHAKA